MKPIAEKADFEDLAEILALQKLAFYSEAAIYDEFTIPPLTETLMDFQREFSSKTILKIVLDNKIVGSIRGYFDNNIVHIERVLVHPDYQKRGLGYILMEAIENHFPNPLFFQLFTGYKSTINLNWYQKLGYEIAGERIFSDKLKLIFLIKKNTNGN